MGSPIRKAVIPAAGLGTRFLPATKAVPKELLPIAGKPIIQYAVEEAVASGIEMVILVISHSKNLVVEHFRRNLTLENILTERGQLGGAAQVRQLSQLAEIRTVYQVAPLGLADAVRTARPLVGDEPFAVILPDALIDSAVPCLRQLSLCYEQHHGSVIATQMVDPEEVGHYGILELESLPDNGGETRTLKVRSLVEKPKPGSVSSRFGIFGRYILESDIFSCIDGTQPGTGGELQLTDALQMQAARVSIFAHRFEGQHYDVGSKLGFLQATMAYALKDPETAAAVQEYLVGLGPPELEAAN